MTTLTLDRPDVASPGRDPRRSRLGRRAAGWLFVVGLLTLWQVAGMRDTSGLLPPVTEIAEETWMLLTSEALTQDVLPSVLRALLGFVAGSLLGVAGGIVLGWWRFLQPWTGPALEFLRAVPPPVLVPIAVAAFGSTGPMKVAVIALGTLWPVLLNTTDGIRRVDSGYVESARVYTSGSSLAILRRVALPAATPQIMTGLRIGLAISLIMMVISEMFGASSGLGHLILQAQRLYAMTTMYAGVLLLGLIGLLLTMLFSLAEKRALAWFDGMKGRTYE